MGNEIWKDIKGFEGLYQISNLGRVKSLPKYIYSRGYPQLRKEKLLKPCYVGKYRNYLAVRLNDNIQYKIHRLVAEAFIPNPNNLPQVDHIDDNKENNRVENLQWITNEDNRKKAWLTGAITLEKNYKRGKDSCHARIVNQYDLNGNFIKKWYCIKDIQDKLGFDNRNISACCRKKRPTAYGYKWEYLVE